VTIVVVAALGLALGGLGVVLSIRRRSLTLDDVLAVVTGETERRVHLPAEASRWRVDWRVDRRAASHLAKVVEARGIGGKLSTRMALCGTSLEELCRRCLLAGGVGVLLPVLADPLLSMAGFRVGPVVPLWVGLMTAATGAAVPIWGLSTQARHRHRQAIRVVCSFLDLVVLGLAGAMGIESALFSAAEMGENDFSDKMKDALMLSRDAGVPPWTALRELAAGLGVTELEDVATAAALAGTEGAKVRATLAARAASIRRHQLADAEAEANGVTERLFLPGTLLLVGFLLFVGYPAVARIMTGL